MYKISLTYIVLCNRSNLFETQFKMHIKATLDGTGIIS